MKIKVYFAAVSAILSFAFFVEPASALTQENISIFGSSLRMIWGLLIVLGILLIIYGLVKKRITSFHGGGKGIIKVIETRHLLPKKTLFLVEVRGKEFLLGSGSDSLQLISPLDTFDPTPSFDELLQSKEQDRPV
ncbi:MAG: flagellar biosynthetic protein FliO [Desulfobacterales bacterium]|nr:flagellar biosynthetic protein FliO [Desulfobacterales bacterium]